MRSPLTWFRQWLARNLFTPLDDMYERIDANLLGDTVPRRPEHASGATETIS